IASVYLMRTAPAQLDSGGRMIKLLTTAKEIPSLSIPLSSLPLTCTNGYNINGSGTIKVKNCGKPATLLAIMLLADGQRATAALLLKRMSIRVSGGLM